MNIKILGPGCKKCETLEKEVKEVLKELEVTAEVEKVTEQSKILEYPVLLTPGLVINEKVKTYGRVPKREDIVRWIKEEQ